MKYLYQLVLLLLLPSAGTAQAIYANGANIRITAGGTLHTNGSFTNQNGNFQNDGNFSVKGNIVFNQNSTDYAGTLTLAGTSPQIINGSSPLYVKNLIINNPAGITLNTPVNVNGVITFTSGVINTISSPLVFASGAVHNGGSNSSHVNGFVKKLGTGIFVFPVGNGVRYQPVATNLTDNSDGLSARYFAENAGTATFGTSGASSISLNSYNTQEYWDLIPAGTATGKVTVSWDNFQNPSITSSTNVGVFKVAHKTASGWLNEGSSAVSGNITAGSVTSETISSWSPFTLGAILESALPVTLINFTAKAIENDAILNWQTTSEANASYFEIQRSLDAKTFEKIGQVEAAGNSNALETYSFTDGQFGNLPGTVYYRLKSVDLDGTFTLTRSVSLKRNDQNLVANLYPNPAQKESTVTIMSKMPINEICLWNLLGTKIPLLIKDLQDGKAVVNLQGISAGTYFFQLKTADGVVNKKLVIQ